MACNSRVPHDPSYKYKLSHLLSRLSQFPRVHPPMFHCKCHNGITAGHLLACMQPPVHCVVRILKSRSVYGRGWVSKAVFTAVLQNMCFCAQASSPPRKAGQAPPLEDMSAGLPPLHLSDSEHPVMSGNDVLKPLGHFGSDELAAPSLNTPAPSERSLATASTTSTSTSLISSHTSSSDTAKAIEAVRQALEAKESRSDAQDATTEGSEKQAETEQA